MTPVRLEPLAPPSQVKHSTTPLPNLMWKAVNVLKLEIRIANREDPDQTASEKQPDLEQRCLSRHFCRATSVLPAKSDSDVMFCLQSYQGLRIDRSLDGMIGLIHK